MFVPSKSWVWLMSCSFVLFLYLEKITADDVPLEDNILKDEDKEFYEIIDQDAENSTILKSKHDPNGHLKFENDYYRWDSTSTPWWWYESTTENDYYRRGSTPRPGWRYESTTENDYYRRGSTPRPWWRYESTTENDYYRRGSTQYRPWWRYESTTENDYYRRGSTPRPWWRYESTTVAETKDHRRTTEDWWPSSTVAACDCGEKSISCEFDFFRKKICSCLPGYAQVGETCSDCYCGENADGCFFDSRGNKICVCSKGYAQRNRTCSETCSKQRNCLNGGLCRRGEKGANFCQCRYNFGGAKCEVNEICQRLEPNCNSMGAVCRLVGMAGVCECPPHKVFQSETGQCEDICNSKKCVHGTCEIIEKDFKCKCDDGFGGFRCDHKIRVVGKGILYIWIVISVFIVTVLIFLITACYFLYKTNRAKKSSA